MASRGPHFHISILPYFHTSTISHSPWPHDPPPEGVGVAIFRADSRGVQRPSRHRSRPLSLNLPATSYTRPFFTNPAEPMPRCVRRRKWSQGGIPAACHRRIPERLTSTGRMATTHLAKNVGADKSVCRACALLLVPSDKLGRVRLLDCAARRQHHLNGDTSRQSLHEMTNDALVRARTVVVGLAFAVVHEPFDENDVWPVGYHVAFEAEYAQPRTGSANRRINELETRVRIALLKPAPDQRPP